MPFIIPLVAAVAGAAVTAAAGSALIAAGFTTVVAGVTVLSTTGVIIASLAGAAVAMAVSYAGSALVGSPKSARGAINPNELGGRTQQLRLPITSHRVVYGRARVSGPIVFLWTNPERLTDFKAAVTGGVAHSFAKEDLIYLVHVLAAHRIESVEAVFLDDKPLSDEAFRGHAFVSWSLGGADQAANPMLVAETQGAWTTEHRLRGRAYLASSFQHDPAIFRSGIPNVSAIIRGSQVYDPRTGRTAWSDNAALCVADYLTGRFGPKAGWDEIDIPALIAAANICDEPVPLKDGTTERRYTCNGSFELDEAPGRILERLLSSMAGTAVWTGGKWVIHAGAWSPPSVTLTEDHLRGAVQVRANRPARDLHNGVRAVYVRPAAGWQPTDAPPLQDAEALVQDGGVESYADLQLDFTSSGYTAQRLQQIALRKNRAQRQVVAPLNMIGLQVRCMDTVTLSLPRLPTTTYRVTAWRLTADGVDVTLEQEGPEAWAWNPDRDERPLGGAASVVYPTGLTLQPPGLAVTTPTAPVPATISGTVVGVPDATTYAVQWRGPNSSDWQDATVTGAAWTAPTGGRAAFRVRARAPDLLSPWQELGIPSEVAYLSAGGTSTGIQVAWTLPADGVRGQVFIGTTDGFETSVRQGTDQVAELAVPLGDNADRWVWVRAVSTEGNVGPPVGPIVVARNTAGGEINNIPVEPARPNPYADWGGGDNNGGDPGAGDDGGGGAGGGGDGGE